MAYVDLLILSLDPSQLVHHFIAPLVHAFVANVHLRVQDPKEAKALATEHFHWDVHDLRVRHGAIV